MGIDRFGRIHHRNHRKLQGAGKEKSILYRTGEFILYILIGAGLLIYAMIRATKIKMKEKKEASLTDKEKEL